MNKQALPGILGAGLGMGIYLALNLLVSNGYVDDPTATRAGHVLYGMAFLIIGNMLPKKICPLPDISLSSPRVQSLRRFAGWTLALAGLSYSITWLLVPANIAEIVGVSIAGVCLVLVIPPTIWVALTRNRDQQPTNS